ncbi:MULTISPECIES: hypothetical protein [Chryseobacterium]|uniref:Uncharacterized protein n=1 Tax=Chryseobacterium indoltheticum TaxID=254 RepID=A0A381FLW3_9FLAO|nr:MULTISPECIES: hypothetical protein [Chryseobacterium]MDQ8142427.1 hypothetical protein [Chryseobacterium sp. CFS15]SUX47202.1 Uncharacterised protein [Chryseobacterium indoltheticum]
MKRIFLTLIILTGCSKSKPSTDTYKKNIDYYERCRLLVLEENIPKQNFEFEKKGKEIDQQIVRYLGNIVTTKKDTLKIVNSIHYTGVYEDAKRGNGQLYIYSINNELLGYYNLGSALAVPNDIENNRELIFKYDNESCNQTTKISLRDSIPKKIFIQCTKEGGDLYNLQKE